MIAPWKILFESNPCLPLKETYRALEGHMAGGRIAFDGQETLYLASGDYHWDGMYAPAALAQDEAADYGKVIAINVFSGNAEQVSRGHRNTQGIAIDNSGSIWVTEQGVRGGDELNLIKKGENYGWPDASLGTK